jgi:hypothetical protein
MNISSSTIQGREAISPVATLVTGSFSRLWQGLQRFGQRRAARQLEFLAQQYLVSEPALAQQLRKAAADCRAGADGTGEGARS